ncbi:MAG TPA: LysM peptidoglycan-binding domain-containing protein [bacterium]|nr:LysM peptidoglycan-binding domain-containing protein [bacterium]
MRHSRAWLAVLLTGSLITAGCAGNKRIEGADAPLPPPVGDVAAAPPAPEPPAPEAAAPTPAPTAAPAHPPSKYIVVKGDTLWDISEKSLAYHDYFQWPLIFKANRDQITDPDLIYPKQEFSINHDWSDADITKARNDASATPKYVPHTKPRNTLPVDYF